MKIAVSSASNAALNSTVDPRFGRCAFYTIIEVEEGKIINVQSLSNSAASEFFVAGVQALQILVEHGVTTIITGTVGPKSFYELRNAGIPVYTVESDVNVSQALELFLKDKLSLISEPGIPHRGKRRN